MSLSIAYKYVICMVSRYIVNSLKIIRFGSFENIVDNFVFRFALHDFIKFFFKMSVFFVGEKVPPLATFSIKPNFEVTSQSHVIITVFINSPTMPTGFTVIRTPRIEIDIHSTLVLTWIPIKVFRADSMLLSIGKSWGIFPIKQKFNTMAAFVDSKNYQNQISLLKPKNVYHCAELLQLIRKSAKW